MSTNHHTSQSLLTGTSVVTPEIVEAAMQRGRRERSIAFWTMLQAVFGRPEGTDERHVEGGDRNAALAR